ncbi:MAG TPA: PQQ-binding-like beta-propeller repeat protein [Candidatus Acidoferrales bacterium]|nr:PQQ-binding-like beta-propeller repeat protein [Candidatus Acidoferrales bacterium]
MRFLYILVAAGAVLAQDGVPSGGTRADWPHHGGTQMAWRYSALDQINTTNVRSLAPAWMFQTGDYGDNLQATPIVIDGVMYISTPYGQVFALDAANGRLIWHYKYALARGFARPGSQSAFRQNRGVAVGDGKVFLGTADNYLVAIDQKTGREVWRVNIDDSKQCGCNITAAPLVVKDKVIVGGSGGDGAHRGYLTALAMRTGRVAWRFYVIPGPGEKGHETWKGDSWKFGGGAPWMTGSYDAGLNLVFWGTGNAAGDFYAADRYVGGETGGETVGEAGRTTSGTNGVNLYTASVVALDADTSCAGTTRRCRTTSGISIRPTSAS